MGTNNRNVLAVDASVSAMESIQSFVGDLLEQCDCPMKAQYQISVVIDEIYANIASYSGASQAEVAFDFDEGSRTVTLTFTDDGKPYNPLEAKEPDTSLSADERPIGGLGIFIVRKTMDEVDYEYREGKNVLTLKKAV